jgi:hypothetical protein
MDSGSHRRTFDPRGEWWFEVRGLRVCVGEEGQNREVVVATIQQPNFFWCVGFPEGASLPKRDFGNNLI